jgi:hypothetical protein
MLTKLTCLAFAFAATTASAATITRLEPAGAVDPVARTREDAQRIWYHDQELRIAEQDLTSARIDVALTREHWDAAVTAKHPDAAGTWAQRHFAAMQAEKEAFGRVQLHRAEHDIARDDFQRDAAWVRAEARLSTRKRG